MDEQFIPPTKLHDQTAEEWAEELFKYQVCDSCGHDKEMHDIIPLDGNWFARCLVDEKEPTPNWSDKQKIAFIKIQDILSEMDLTNEEVAEMFSTYRDNESVYTLFRFQTRKWMQQLKME